MNYRRLGKSGLLVSELSLGSWLTFGNQIEDGVAEKLMHMAYDTGVNFFDTSESYENGKAENVRVTKVKCGNTHCVALLNLGVIALWGENEYG